VASKVNRVGEKQIMSNGMEAEIIKYNNYRDIDIKFEDGKIRTRCFYSCFKNGQIGYYSREELKRKRENELFENDNGEVYKIVEYNTERDIVVEFQDEFKARVKTTYSNAKIGCVRNPYRKGVFGVGYLGVGRYSASRNNIKIYNCWMHMLERCYTRQYHELCPTYKECVVCDEWHNFQNFAKWYEENYYKIDGYESHLDKDILVKGNKIYSPETCIFVPENINSVFSSHCNNTGNLLGIKRTEANTYQTRVDKQRLKTYKTLDEAFENYKNYKEKSIKELADKYKAEIPIKLYDAMQNWKIELEDLIIN